MIITLLQHPTKGWLLMAQQLDDPETWDRFVPTHSMQSERFHFEQATMTAAGVQIKIKICKDMLKRGVSAYEYDWQTDEDAIITHALQVSDALGVELVMGESKTAA
jgi:hypothetical protein